MIARKPTAKSLEDLSPALSAPLDAAASAAFTASGAPGAVVAVRTPEGTWVKAYGVSDVVSDEPMTTDTYHRVASVTKTFTASVILQLVEEKEISLSDPISEYVPDVPNGSNITLLELATMTSGINDYLDGEPFLKVLLSDYSIIWSTDELLATAYAMPTTSAPGVAYYYSNTNYILLGLVIEKVTGQSLAQEFSSRIIEPLELTGTSYDPESSVLPDPYAHGYSTVGVVDGSVTLSAPRTDVTVMNTSEAGAAGAMLSRVDDLLSWGRALATGQGLLLEDTQTQRLTSFPDEGGYGIGLVCSDGWVGHAGVIFGYTTEVRYDTDTDTTVVVETNGDKLSGTPAITSADTIYHSVAGALRQRDPSPDPPADPRQ